MVPSVENRRTALILVLVLCSVLVVLPVMASDNSGVINSSWVLPLEWNKDYTLLGTGRCVIQTKDGGYAVAGETNNKFLLLKTDSSGDVQWKRTYGDGEGYAIVQTRDEGYALVGSGTNFNLVKTDSSGNVQWNKYYGKPEARYLIQTSDGGYALLVGASWRNIDLVVKTDADGNMLWNKTYGIGLIYSIVNADDGGYMISGVTSTVNPISMLIKIDSSGNVQWNKTGNFGSSLVKTEDGGYVMVGTSTGLGLLIKTDSQGNIQWRRSYEVNAEDPLATSYFASVAQTSDGGYVIGEIIWPAPLALEGGWAEVIKTDSLGNIERTVTLPGIDNYIESIIGSDDGGCVFTGSKRGIVWLDKIESSIIQEFPSWVILPLFLLATLLVTIYRKRLHRKRHGRPILN